MIFTEKRFKQKFYSYHQNWKNSLHNHLKIFRSEIWVTSSSFKSFYYRFQITCSIIMDHTLSFVLEIIHLYTTFFVRSTKNETKLLVLKYRPPHNQIKTKKFCFLRFFDIGLIVFKIILINKLLQILKFPLPIWVCQQFILHVLVVPIQI